MGMSVSLIGVRKKDGKWDKMIKAKLACEEAEVDYPQEVKDYFESEGTNAEDDPETLWSELQEVSFDWGTEKRGREVLAEDQTGWEIRVDDIPDDIEWIKAVMS